MNGGLTTGASSTLLPALALRCDRLGHSPLSRLFQAANDADSAESAFRVPSLRTHVLTLVSRGRPYFGTAPRPA